VKQEKEFLIIQLSESHVLIESLKSENTMLLNTINELENKLKKFSSGNLKSMLCFHSDVSNKPYLTVDDLSTSTLHAFDSEFDSIDIKPVIEDITCVDNSCVTNHVMPKSKESGIQGKFIPKCHNCGNIGHIRPNCYLLKFHRPWIKQDALRKIKNANHISAEKVKQHSNKTNLPTVITAASSVTSDANVHSSKLRRRRLRGIPDHIYHGYTRVGSERIRPFTP